MKSLLVITASLLVLAFNGFGQEQESTAKPSTEKKQVEKQKVTLKPARKAKKAEVKTTKKATIKATVRKKPVAKSEDDQ